MSGRQLSRVISPALPVQGRNKITKHVEREVICHSNFCHPHVIQFKEIFLTPTHLAIAMEYAPGGDMFQFVKRSSGLKVLISTLTAALRVAFIREATQSRFIMFTKPINLETVLCWFDCAAGSMVQEPEKHLHL